MTNPMISIIVPIYNAKDSIQKCVSSICSQTYKNLEIILVDDGSKDGSAAECDHIAENDPRVKVIHQENSGVSATRNKGLSEATGEYIGFVDSDDWIESDMYEKLLKAILSSDAQIAVCGIYREFKKETKEIKKADKQQILTKDEAICDMINNRLHSLVVWNKLWEKDLITQFRFPVGKVFEDAATTWKIVMAAKNVVYIPDCLYHYNQIEGSLVHTYTLKNFSDEWTSTEERFRVLSSKYPDINMRTLQECAMVIARTWGWCLNANKQERRQYQTMLNEMSVFIRQHVKEIAKSNYPVHIRIGCLFAISNTSLSFIMASSFHKLFRFFHGGTRRLIK